MKPTTLLWCATVVACANVAPPPDLAIARLDQARSLLSADPDRALGITDELLATAPDWREARLVAAEGWMQLAKRTNSGGELMLQDAQRNFERALAESDEPALGAAWRRLADCRFELGDFAGAAEAAQRAARLLATGKTEDRASAAGAAALLAGNAQLRLFAAARQQELDTGTADRRGTVPVAEPTARLAATALASFAAARATHPGEAIVQIATVHTWLEQQGAAVEELERGLRTHPGESRIHEAYLDRMCAMGQQDALVGAYTRLRREQAGAMLVQWYQARALHCRADHLRRQGNSEAALSAYERSRATFGEYGAMVPAHADSVAQWEAICDLACARVFADRGDVDGARQKLFAADTASPLAIAYDDGRPRLVDGLGSHYASVVATVGGVLAERGEGALEATLAWYEEMLQRHPGRWGFAYNNAALVARDLGVRREREGDTAAAKELWERSYRHYEQAVALSPDDARIANDCGLMLIYHLHRDYDRARGMFERAIELGSAQLAGLAADTPQRDRELLEEAVGDAWQNIAVLLRECQRKPFADYEPFCVEAVKYYPYQRREAAALLRSEGAVELASPVRGQPGAAFAAAQGGAADALAKVRPQVQEKASQQDFDGALTVLDGIAKECKEHAPYHLLRGEITLQLAAQSRDAGRKGVDFLYQDAVNALKKAVELDAEPAAPRLLLAQAQYESGDLENAATTASQLLLHLQSQGGGDAEIVLRVHGVRANAAARAYAGAKAEQKDLPEMLTAARASFRQLEAKDRLDAALRQLWSATEQWAGASAEAVNVHVRALAKNPEDQALLQTIVDTADASGQLPLAIEALKARDDATSRWYLGRACYLLAAAERAGDKNAAALKTLDEARRYFGESMAKNAGFRDSCEQWIAMCLGKKGNIAFWAGDLASAETWLLDAVRLRPDRIGEDLGLAETTKLGLLRVADAWLKKEELAKVEAIYRAASDAADKDLDLLNNSGLFARDFGNQLERDGKTKEAMGMYEQSYKAYGKARELDPTNVRLRNDQALIAIYHLDRDWELSKQLLDSAIADGDRMLKDSPPEDAQDKQNLEEAVGDCYENLALWHLHAKDAAAAKAAALKSQDYHPKARRGGARRHLQAAEAMAQGK
jgi:hypothetical protein